MALPTKPQCVMSPLGHIVERCEGSYTQPELHRGIKGKYQLPETSCFYRPQLIYSWSEDASPETLPAVVQTAGLEPALFAQWHSKAPLFQLSYICIPPASAGVRRKERMERMRIRI